MSVGGKEGEEKSLSGCRLRVLLLDSLRRSVAGIARQQKGLMSQ